MADDRARAASEYSSSKAPETRAHAPERVGNYSDWRLIPGGRSGSEVSVGMDSLDRESVPSQAMDTGHSDHGRSPAGPRS